MSHLTNTTHWCRDEMNTKLKLAKNILSAAQLAQTMETEKEKVLPFDTGVAMTSMANEERRRFEKRDAPEDLNLIKQREDMRVLMSACGPAEPVCGAVSRVSLVFCYVYFLYWLVSGCL